MRRVTAYRVLCAAVTVLLLLLGFALLYGFVGGTIMPERAAPTAQGLITNYWGYYMMGFAGALLFAWGGCLFSAALRPAISRGIGTATAFGLVINAIFRMMAWFSGEYAEVGNLPRIEAAIMLALALAFVWLRPPPFEPSALDVREQRSTAI
jgi:hypothetical protein